MGIGAFAEPLIVVGLLAGGTLFNQDKSQTVRGRTWHKLENLDDDDVTGEFGAEPGSDETMSPEQRESLSESSSATLLESMDDAHDAHWRTRTLRLWRWQKTVVTPNTRVFENRLLSRVLRRFPFLVETWYWALIYWVYQLARAFSAVVLIDEGTVNIARRHALQLIHLEQRLHVFIERPIQDWFISHPTLMYWTNRTYSFIHIPGSILFLAVFFYITTTRPQSKLQRVRAKGVSPTRWRAEVGRLTPELYEQRRRTMATCNLIAFVIFTAWPCMPPRLLSDPSWDGPNAEEAKSYGFVDTVHGSDGASSVWTTNRFANQYAAMPSLHFGYSLLIGLTVATLPLDFRGPYAWKRWLLTIGGLSYPVIILAAIVSTANHFVLDAVAGACVVAVAWHSSGLMLNLLPLEDYFLRLVRIHKPSKALVNLKGAPLSY